MSALIAVLSGRTRLSALSPQTRATTLRCAERLGLLTRLWLDSTRSGDLERLPPRTAAKLSQSRFRADAAAARLRQEAAHLADALRPLGLPVIVLKGAAYELAGDAAALGRISGDVDILVPKAGLDRAERLLATAGWRISPDKASPADQHYYRAWMHELPPMRHRTRGTELDVHHTILPPVGRLVPAIDRLLLRTVPLSPAPLHALHPHDRILHACAHLFFDGAAERGLRNLLEIADLLLEHVRTPQAWAAFVDRAHEVNLPVPAYYGARLAGDLFGIAGPPDRLRSLARAAGVNRPSLLALFRTRITAEARLPGGGWAARAAAGPLFVRGHWIKMPLPLLIRHALNKQRRSTRLPARQDRPA
ncbi:MAG: nucleotidyltransferase family protein [Rhodothalassiaceae bacterium]